MDLIGRDTLGRVVQQLAALANDQCVYVLLHRARPTPR